jgi:hypothetical protein
MGETRAFVEIRAYNKIGLFSRSPRGGGQEMFRGLSLIAALVGALAFPAASLAQYGGGWNGGGGGWNNNQGGWNNGQGGWNNGGGYTGGGNNWGYYPGIYGSRGGYGGDCWRWSNNHRYWVC